MARVSLRQLLGLTALVAALVGAAAAWSEVGLVAAVGLWGAAGAWCAWERERHVVWGAWGAAAAVVLVVAVRWVETVAEYLRLGVPDDPAGFDGFECEVIQLPILSVFFYVPFGALFGACVGYVAWRIGRVVRRMRRRRE